MQAYPIDHISQTEQEGGYWLISLKLPSTCFPTQKSSSTTLKNSPPLFHINDQFRLSNSDERLFLFQHTPFSTQHHLQFLGKKKVVTTTSSQLQITPSTLRSPPQIEPTENLLLLGSELHIAPLFYLAKQRSVHLNAYLNADHGEKKGQTLALLHSHDAFPFRVKPAQLMSQHLPPQAIGCSTLLEDWKITNRLSNDLGLPGCFDGDLAELFSYWLDQTNQDTLACTPWHIIISAPPTIKKKCLTLSQPYDWIRV